MISVRRKDYLIIPLIILFALETWAVTDYKHPYFSQLTSTFIFLFAGILIAVLPSIIRVREQNHQGAQGMKSLIIARTVFGIFFLLLTLFVIHNAQINLAFFPIDYHNADMIPQIKVCCDRLMSGEKVYAPMMEIWNGKLTTYLPTMWLPYLPFEYLGWDLRWTGVFILMLFFGIYIFLISEQRREIIYTIPVLAICTFILWFLFYQEPTFIAWTEESVVIGYYLFLGWGLCKRNPWIIGTAAALCLLSRYALLFWIPVYILFSFLFESKKSTAKIFVTLGLLVLVLFLLPFGIGDMNYFLKTPGLYLEQAMFIRKHSSDIYTTNIGFANFFLAQQFPLLHRLIIAVAFVIPVLCLIIFIVFRKRLEPVKRYFGLCSLKLTLVIFYSFIEMPFYYLFFVPLFFSLPIIFLSMSRSEIAERKTIRTS